MAAQLPTRPIGAALEAGDTSAAIALFQTELERYPESGELHLALGALLTAHSNSIERDFRTRILARSHLDRALEILGQDPRAYLHLGLLLFKQNKRIDALRVLDRAIELQGDSSQLFTDRDWASIHLARATQHELIWRDWESVVWLPPIAKLGWPCPAGGILSGSDETIYSVIGTACPERWWESSDLAVPLEDLKQGDREAALADYRAALDMDPSLEPAAQGLFRLLGDDQAWREYLHVADLFEPSPRAEHRAYLYRAVALFRLHRFGEAEAAFAEAYRLGDSATRGALSDIELLISRKGKGAFRSLGEAGRTEAVRRLFVSEDPSYLTDANERRLEHLARVAWADVRFGAPRSGRRGWDTDRGRIYIRYGEPARRQQCCRSGDSAPTETWDYWSYGEHGPVFPFRRYDTYRLSWLAGKGQFIADVLGESNPHWYRPAHITAELAIPLQVARFRGRHPGDIALEWYVAPPYAGLAGGAGDSVEVGLFLFTEELRPLWKRLVTAPVVAGAAPPVTYKAETQPGSYFFSAEARAAGPDSVPRALAKARGEIEAVRFPRDRLSLSDIVLVRAVERREDYPNPRHRGELVYRGLPHTALEPDEPLTVLLELYEVQPSEEGYGRVTVEVEIQDAERRSAFARLGRAIGRLFGGEAEDGTTVRWERELPLASGGGVEWFQIQPDQPLEPGDYRLMVRVTDLTSGASAEGVREFSVVAADGGVGP